MARAEGEELGQRVTQSGLQRPVVEESLVEMYQGRLYAARRVSGYGRREYEEQPRASS